MTDYEKYYQEDEKVCGDPFPELITFFDKYDKAQAQVLDLGCGQGRDALMAASYGHTVYGVDLAPTGIAQMEASAREANLNVAGEVANVCDFVPTQPYDVVIVDRVLHMLSTKADKQMLLSIAQNATAPNGFVVIVDTKTNLPLIDAFFSELPNWQTTFKKKGTRFFNHTP